MPKYTIWFSLLYQTSISQNLFNISLYDIFTQKILIKMNWMQELYGLGARRIGVIGLPVLGCVPFQRTIQGGIHRECSDFENHAATLFNNKLSSQIDALKKQFPETKFVYLEIYNPLLNMIQNATKYGNQTHLLPLYKFYKQLA